MKTSLLLPLAAAASFVPTSFAASTPPALTIYNQDFAVVRETLPLNLPDGTSPLSFSGATSQLEPDSVVLRDPTGKVPLRVLEQSYRSETASQELLLKFNEGKTLDFLVRDKDGREHTVRGAVVRAGYGGEGSPVIEVDGQLRFSLPGEPLFPSLSDDAILKPTLSWQVYSPKAAKLDAELAYVTGGLDWHATYNFVLPEKGSTMDVVGWVTVENNSGHTFTDAAVKLMAGNVNKIQQPMYQMAKTRNMMMALDAPAPAGVTEKTFDEFHLYSLPQPVTLRNGETKQVEFIRAAKVPVETLYVYDGASFSPSQQWDLAQGRADPNYGNQSNKKVWVMREFNNTKENNLGIPLPAGRTRFYRQDDADGRLEFVGENTIEHTPQGELVRLYVGDSFDLVGERTRTDFTGNNFRQQAEEAFEIKVRNRKAEPATVRVVEHLYRGVNWEIIAKSDDFTKKDAQTIEWQVPLKPDEEKVLTYRVRYTWK